VRAGFNLLMDPGKNVYLEIQDPSGSLRYAFSLSRERLTLLWAKEQEYVSEPSSAQNLMAVTGFPLSPDDLMLLISGSGLNFPEWAATGSHRDGWSLARAPFTAELRMKNEISRITVDSPSSPSLHVSYSDYAMINNRLTPRSIRFEVPERRLSLHLTIDKLLPRDEPADPALFEVQIPGGATKRPLRELYSGKPLIYMF
jgi:hypothetical protein